MNKVLWLAQTSKEGSAKIDEKSKQMITAGQSIDDAMSDVRDNMVSLQNISDAIDDSANRISNMLGEFKL
jgi:methyl-accepting chemotaxis protein